MIDTIIRNYLEKYPNSLSSPCTSHFMPIGAIS